MNINDEGQAKILAAARAGDSEAFSLLVEPHRLELLTYCYRMLGSVQEAEDQVQETFLKAWRRLNTFEGRASFRTWLYKIATNTCLNSLKHHSQRILPMELASEIIVSDVEALPNPELSWIEPFPEKWLAPRTANPEASYDAYEAISLAFLVALQVLPPRQRAILIFRDVLDWSTSEIADSMGVSPASVTSLLHRARITMGQRNIGGRQDASKMRLPENQTKELLNRYLQAWEAADIDGIIALLTDDAAFPMPPLPLSLRGKPAIRAFLLSSILAGDVQNRWKLVPIRANGRPGFAYFQLEVPSNLHQAFAIQVLEIENGLVSSATTFGFPFLFRCFDLPPRFEDFRGGMTPLNKQ